MDTKDIGLVAGGLAVAGVSGYFIWKYFQEQQNGNGNLSIINTHVV